MDMRRQPGSRPGPQKRGCRRMSSRDGGAAGCKPVSVPRCRGDSHSSRPAIADWLQRPTRESNGAGRSSPPIWSCSAWGLPCRPDYSGRGELLPHLFTLTRRHFASGRYIFCGTFRRIRLNGSPRPLAGMLPCGDRTFLSRAARAHQRLPTHDSVTIIADTAAGASDLGPATDSATNEHEWTRMAPDSRAAAHRDRR